VLAAGDTTGAQGIEFSLGNTGIVTEINPGGAGENLFISAGDTSAPTSSGGSLILSGGLWTGLPGKPGAVIIQADSTAGSSQAGAVNLLGGTGANGNGGTIFVHSGLATGGRVEIAAGDGIAVNDPGGDLTIDAGDSYGTADGGRITITAGNGGLGGGTGDGAPVIIEAGAPVGTGDPGGVALIAGGATPASDGVGNVDFASTPFGGDLVTASYGIIGKATSVTGGNVLFQSGNAPVASGGDAGTVTLISGVGDGAGADGSIHLLGDGAAPTSVPIGGDIQAVAKFAAGTGEGAKLRLNAAAGGGVGSGFLSGGDADAGAGLPGGSAALAGGAGDGPAPGGIADVAGGAGGATGDGGPARIRGGLATGGANVGGDVVLTPGAGGAGQGLVKIEGKIDPAVALTPGIQYGTFAIPGPGVGPFPIPFNTAFSAAPTVVNFSMEYPVPVAGQDVVIGPGGTTAVKFDVVAAIAFAGGEIVHWVAYQ
jgi:hypothetical protein